MEKKILYCPICKKELCRVEKGFIGTKKVSCKKCKKWIWFDNDGNFEIRKIPERTTSSGKVFY